MKICIAQTRPTAGDIPDNMESHKRWIAAAVLKNADMVFFPELSLTGYEPKLADGLAIDPDDKILDGFQVISDRENITIGAGVPTRHGSGIRISIAIFSPNQPRQVYSKQILHEDEFPYFENGRLQVVLECQNEKVSPAICYESLQTEHADKAAEMGVKIYVACVAKSAGGVVKAYNHYREIAIKHGMVVLMANSVGTCDDFISAGRSGIWNTHGELVAQLNDRDEGILLFDTFSGKALW
ncbi:carbon-nitrogen hydrolase family protein [Negadavirga shengliensis]|uniref:Carbon-nitrogen hydrolase family protein n=1 Tax=Negadavirga shengliensis TaxID=1389218 RepID=A0ABV9SX16_9BACT